MRWRVSTAVAVLALAGAVAGCAGTQESRPPQEGSAVPSGTRVANPGSPTRAQLEFREQLLEQLRNGTYGDCECTSAERAKERIADGRAKAPPPDQLVSALP